MDLAGGVGCLTWTESCQHVIANLHLGIAAEEPDAVLAYIVAACFHRPLLLEEERSCEGIGHTSDHSETRLAKHHSSEATHSRPSVYG
ncbi:unnamed protein product [Boreogadus saida]